MDTVFIVVLLSAPRLLVWRRCFLLTAESIHRKMPVAITRAIRVPKAQRNDHESKVANGMGDRPVRARLASVNSRNTVGLLAWHPLHWTSGELAGVQDRLIRTAQAMGSKQDTVWC